jgi:hypothetical protein
MCKRSFSDFAARPSKRITTRNSRPVAASKAAVTESIEDGEEPTLGELMAAGGTLEEIKSQICGLTNDLHPLFDKQNICVCKNADRRYCFLPEKIAELESAADEIEGALEPHWEHGLGEFMLYSAMQLATRMITHEYTLPFWAGLIDCARPSEDGKRREFNVRARKRLNAAKEKEVLEYLNHAAGRIRIHLKSFSAAGVRVWKTAGLGFVQFFDYWEDPYNCDPNQPEATYGFRDGKPALYKDCFVHMWLNVDQLVYRDLAEDDWDAMTISDMRGSMLQFATTFGHELAHAMVDITQNGRGIPSFNEEMVIETGFSWEHFVLGGRLCTDDSGRFCVAPWPDETIWKQYAEDGKDLCLCAFGRGALPLEVVHVVEDHVWMRFLEQRFWDDAHPSEGTFKKLWLRGGKVKYDKSHYGAREVVVAAPKARRVCFDEEEKQRRRVESIQARGDEAMADRPDRWDRVVDRVEERRNAFHESEGKPILDEFWASCTKHVDEDVFIQQCF